MDDILEVEFDKMVYEGKALGRKDGKVVFAYGVLPGEKARIKKTIEKKDYIEGEVIEVISKSPYRIEPCEGHFLSCSPWQIIDYEKQVEYKKRIIIDGLYQSMKEVVNFTDFYKAEKIWAYRTKMEYSFSHINGTISLAFHKRGDYSIKLPLNNGCILINEKANSVALDVVKQLNDSGKDLSPLKALIIRYSFYDDSVISALFVKDSSFSNNIRLSLPFHKGHINVYSRPQSPVSSVDGIIYSDGCDVLKEKILNKLFLYRFDCFFQNNLALFSKVIEIIKDEASKFNKVVDLYSGVGVIGISVAEDVNNVFLVEASQASFKFLQMNADSNCVDKNITAFCMPSENIDVDMIENACVILDPPRAGLHKHLIKKIMTALPYKIIYLSCNPITQGRDLVYLLERYRLVNFYGFDFYPNTPHAESLAILDRR
ncbi:MAG: class I SAM-dependent RNA methyltransferase [Elusimicrobiales bacterium]